MNDICVLRAQQNRKTTKNIPLFAYAVYQRIRHALSVALQLKIIGNIMPAVQLAAIYIVMLPFEFPSRDYLYGFKFILINVNCKWETSTDKGNSQL